MGFQILFEDEFCIVVAKPAGLLTQAPLGIDSLEFQLKRYLRQGDPQSQEVYLGVPHRIDRPVSGVIVFAKTRQAARRISRQFEARMVQKIYWALVAGAVTPEAGVWTDYLKKIYGHPRSMVVDQADPLGQIAVLKFAIKQRLADRTLLEIELQTGRTHQIRVQCASRGWPLLGDELYGGNQLFGPPSDDERARLIGLHARQLKFQHPKTSQLLCFSAPLPNYWPDVEKHA